MEVRSLMSSTFFLNLDSLCISMTCLQISYSQYWKTKGPLVHATNVVSLLVLVSYNNFPNYFFFRQWILWQQSHLFSFSCITQSILVYILPRSQLFNKFSTLLFHVFSLLHKWILSCETPCQIESVISGSSTICRLLFYSRCSGCPAFSHNQRHS